MKTSTSFLLSMLIALIALSASANADQVLLTSFESDAAAFDNGATTGTLGATDGTMALQFASPGEFQFTTSFAFFDELTNPLNKTILFDVTFTPDDAANNTFAQVSFGINSNGNNEDGNNFQFVPLTDIAIGTTNAVEIAFADLPEFPLTNFPVGDDPDNLPFAGLILIGNTDQGGSGVFSFDNVRFHIAAVPEPSSLVLLGALGLFGITRRKR